MIARHVDSIICPLNLPVARGTEVDKVHKMHRLNIVDLVDQLILLVVRPKKFSSFRFLEDIRCNRKIESISPGLSLYSQHPSTTCNVIRLFIALTIQVDMMACRRFQFPVPQRCLMTILFPPNAAARDGERRVQ